MQKLPDFVPAFSHHLKPPMRDSAQFTCMLFHPRIDGGIPLDGAVESEKIGFYSRSTGAPLSGKVTLTQSTLQLGVCVAAIENVIAYATVMLLLVNGKVPPDSF